MAKKPSGLGRGLGDLLEDNTPEIRRGQGSVVRKDAPTPSEPPKAKPSAPQGSVPPAPQAYYAYTQVPPKSLYESKHKNKSLKANFKNFK